MEWLVLGLFVLGLVLCVIFHFSVVWALAAGYFFFFSYGLWRRIPAGELWQSSVRGLKTVRTILMVMVLIGMLTTVWRYDSHDCIAGRKSDPAGTILCPNLCIKLLCFLSHRDGFRYGCYNGRHLHVCSQFSGRQPGVDRRRHYERCFFWRPLFPSFDERPPGCGCNAYGFFPQSGNHGPAGRSAVHSVLHGLWTGRMAFRE